MTSTRSEEVQFGPLRGETRRRFLAACGLLARPALDPRSRSRITKLLSRGDWRPLPRLASIRSIEPLMVHHAIQLGFEPGHLFQLEGGNTQSFADMARSYYRRRQVITELLDTMAGLGTTRMLLIKGAAIAPLYPSPALREMSDIDLVLQPAEASRSLQAFTKLGWKPVRNVWTHPSGCLVDVLAPASHAIRQLWDRATPMASYGKDLPVYIPSTPDHLAILALHAARHGGNRLWRDIVDVHALVDGSADIQAVVEKAIQFARVIRGTDALMSLLAIMNRRAFPTVTIPLTSHLTPQQTTIVQLYDQMLVERASPIALDLMASAYAPLPELIASGFRALGNLARPSPKRGGERHQTLLSERDTVLGDLPDSRSPARHWLKLTLICRAVRAHQFSRYWTLLRRFYRLRQVPRTFEPLYLTAHRRPSH